MLDNPYEGIFGVTTETKILEFLMAHPWFEYTRKDLSRNADIAEQKVSKVIDKFLRWGIVKQTRKIDNAPAYTINKDSKIVKAFEKFDNELIKMIGKEELAKLDAQEHKDAILEVIS